MPGALFLAALLGAGGSPSPATPSPLLKPSQPVGSQKLEGYRLQPDRKNRQYLYKSPTFSATIHSDGTVRFRDRHGSLGPLLGSPLPQKLPPGTPSLESEVRRLIGRPRRPDPPSHDLPPGIPVVPRLSPNRPDMNDLCIYPEPCVFYFRPILVGARGTFDLNDEIVRMLGNDPYRYEKARFLAATLDFRTSFGAMNREEDLREALNNLPKILRAIWADNQRTPEQKRNLINALKVDMDTTTESGAKGARMIDLFLARMDAPAER